MRPTQRQRDRVTKSSQLAWDVPGFSTKRPVPRIYPQTWANRDCQSPYRETTWQKRVLNILLQPLIQLHLEALLENLNSVTKF